MTVDPATDAGDIRQLQFDTLTGQLGLSDADASRLMGYSRGSWSLFRNRKRRVPRYLIASLQFATHLRIDSPSAFGWLLAESRKRASSQPK